MNNPSDDLLFARAGIMLFLLRGDTLYIRLDGGRGLLRGSASWDSFQQTQKNRQRRKRIR